MVLAVKTPLALLALAGVGLVACWKRRRESAALLIPVAFAAGVLAVAFFSRINIGVRHVLPVYIAFAILGAAGARKLWEAGTRARWILGGLMAWMVATSAFSHPDYLAYFNALAGEEPENVLVDSDLDWGQDMKRLGARLQELGATEVAFDPFIVAHLEAVHGFPPIKPLDPNGPLPGWNAVSLTMLKLDRMGLKREHPEYQLWPERHAAGRAGRQRRPAVLRAAGRQIESVMAEPGLGRVTRAFLRIGNTTFGGGDTTRLRCNANLSIAGDGSRRRIMRSRFHWRGLRRGPMWWRSARRSARGSRECAGRLRACWRRRLLRLRSRC